jgi:hypothetical protein
MEDSEPSSGSDAPSDGGSSETVTASNVTPPTVCPLRPGATGSGRPPRFVSVCDTFGLVKPFDLDGLDDTDPFEIDRQAAHLFKHDPYGIDDVYEIWNSDPLFYPARPPAHWLMVAEIGGEVLMVPLAPPDQDNPTRCRPIGCYVAARHLADRYKEDR